jgi:hypothetical protein
MEPNLIDETRWAQIREKIGASRSTWVLLSKELEKARSDFVKGEGIDGTKVKELRKTWISDRPLIDADGNPFVLFIYDQAGQNYRPRRRHHNHGSREYKYHFTWCKTLESMTQAGRRARYKAKYDLDNNVFTVNRGRVHDEQQELNVCKYCLSTFNYEGYSDAPPWHREEIYEAFDPAIFFSNHLPQNLIRPSHPFHTGRYPRNWREISLRIKAERGNRCEECGSTKFLQVHHINGVKDNIDPRNLKVLCYFHHSKQPYHTHMR